MRSESCSTRRPVTDRDPRHDPRPGDVIGEGATTREVIERHGLSVTYRITSEAHPVLVEGVPLYRWRNACTVADRAGNPWRVLHRGPDPDDGAKVRCSREDAAWLVEHGQGVGGAPAVVAMLRRLHADAELTEHGRAMIAGAWVGGDVGVGRPRAQT